MEQSRSAEPGSVVRVLYDALAAGDVEQAQRCVSDSFVWHEPLDHPWSGDHRGLAGLLALNSAAGVASGGTLVLDVHDVVSSDEHAVVVQTVTATVDGQQLRLDEVIVAHAREGALTEAWICYREPEPARRLFAAAPARSRG